MKKVLSVLLVLAMALTFSSQAASSEIFKFERDIVMVCPFNPGSVTDIYNLMMKKIAEKYLSVNVVIEYRTGGSGAVGINFGMAAKQDGYTIFTPGNNIEYGLASGRIENYKIEDFVGIANPVLEIACVAVPAKSPFNTMADIINYAKKNPGKLNWAGAQALSYHHMVNLLTNQAADVDINYVPFDNGTEVALGCIEGSVDIAGLPADTAFTFSQSGDVRIVAIGTKERNDAFPGIPTIYETPGLEFEKMGIEYVVIRPVFVGKNTSPEMVAALEHLFLTVFNDKEWQEWTGARAGTDNKGGIMNSAETTQFVRDSYVVLEKVFAELGLK